MDWMTLGKAMHRCAVSHWMWGRVNASLCRYGRRACRPARSDRGAGDHLYREQAGPCLTFLPIGRANSGACGGRKISGDWLDEGDHAVASWGRGLYSFKGSGYAGAGIC